MPPPVDPSLAHASRERRGILSGPLLLLFLLQVWRQAASFAQNAFVLKARAVACGELPFRRCSG